MSEEKKGPARRDPFDGLKPSDFFNGKWPTGEPVTPQALKDYGLTASQLRYHLAVVDGIQALALEYKEYLAYTGKTHESVAKDLGLGLNVIRFLRTGTRFPSFRTNALLRAYVPTHDEMEAKYRSRGRKHS